MAQPHVKTKPNTGSETLTKMLYNKLPVFDLAAEQAVLGAILLDATDTYLYFWQAVECLPDAEVEFYRQSHRDVFVAMRELIEAGQRVDLITLRDKLVQRGVLERVGGEAYLAALMDCVPTAVNIVSHATVVHQKYQRRAVHTAGLQIAFEGYNEAIDDQAYVEQSEKYIQKAVEAKSSAWFSLALIAKPVYEEIEQLSLSPSTIPGLPTGYTDLDRLMGGLADGNLTVLAARPMVGKSALAGCLAVNIAKAGVGVGIFSLEMTKEQWAKRMLSAESRVQATKIKTGKGLDDDDWPRLAQATEVLASLPIYIDETPGIKPLYLRARAHVLQAHRQVGLIIVDHLHIMESSTRRDNRVQEITELSRTLKMLAKELHLPVLALAQLNRGLESRADKRPVLSDLRDSGSIEQDADDVVFLYRPELYGEEANGLTEVIVAKQRNGEVGTIKLVFVKQFVKFESLAFPSMAEHAPGQDSPF